MSAAVVPLATASWLLLALGCLAAAQTETTAWLVTTTARDSELLVTETETTGTEDTTVTDNEEHSTVTTAEYDPGTKLLVHDDPAADNDLDVSQNQVSNPECSEKCAMVVHALSVRSDIKYRYARTVVYSKMGNPANSSNQATFSVTLPDTAFITGFFLEMDGKKYEAYIKKKEQAEKEYQDALEAGNTAAHVGTSTRDSNVFVVSVNVAARSKVTFNLTYEELLRRRLSAYHHTVTLTPGQIVQDMSVDVFIREIRNITFLNVTTSDESRLLESGGDAVVVEYLSPMSAHVHFNPSEGEQQGRLEVGYQQLVVQYDVDRATNPSGDIMLMDGYFVHFFAPENVAPHPKHIVFVLDTSGSMWGRKLQQLQQAMYSILDSLREEDYFSIVQFSTNVVEWSVRPQEMVGLSKYSVTHEVNEVNIAKAKQFIKSMEASGGTNISGALRKALQLAAKEKYGTGSVDESGEKRDFGSEDKPQPMLIFLTDGIATVGELLSSKILAQVRAVNTEIKAAIFSLAFGDGANYRFLKKLSLQNYAFSRKIYEASDAALQLQSFYNEIASPLLANVTFNYLDGKIDKDSLTTNQFHSYYGGSEIVVAGKLSGAEDDDEDLGAEVNAWSGGEHKEVLYKPLCTSEKNQIERRKHHSGGRSLERLWAYLTVRQLLDQHLASTDKDDDVTTFEDKQEQFASRLSPRARAQELALKYGFVTPITSLIVVVPVNGSDDEVSELVKDPVGSNALDPSPVLESAPIQNKIIPLAPFLFRPSPVAMKPSAHHTTVLHSTTTASTTTDYSMMDLNDVPHVTNYTLGDVTWLLDYFDSEDRLIVANNTDNSTYVVVKVPSSPEVTENTEECATPGGEPGNCRIFASCVQSDFLDDYQVFLKFFCPIGRFAGVCCPYSLLNDTSVTTTVIPTVE
ncbi:inter-alpha-trypsin inhibitor heavy chain H3-like [Periplaneta americana]|uniref:inter-alpha-trypsin inhibitor heavy chain H3-like n=1 Tax=Periplaneta americana TaxID=6978 RepID=UPI0037E7970A